MKIRELIEDLTNYLDDNNPEYNPEVHVHFINTSVSSEIIEVMPGSEDIMLFIDGTGHWFSFMGIALL